MFLQDFLSTSVRGVLEEVFTKSFEASLALETPTLCPLLRLAFLKLPDPCVVRGPKLQPMPQGDPAKTAAIWKALNVEFHVPVEGTRP